jgi:hypothetical protein
VAAATKVASSLVAKGLAREIRAKADAPVWHENDDGRFALKITKAGREAIGVDEEEGQQAASSSATPDASKPKKRGSKAAGKKAAAETPKARTKAARATTAGNAESSPAQVRAGSKQAKIIDLMKRAKGATLDDMIEATEWLPHTTRAALAGLRKRGITVDRIKDEAKGPVYRIKSDRAPVAALRMRAANVRKQPAKAPAASDLEAELARIAGININDLALIADRGKPVERVWCTYADKDGDQIFEQCAPPKYTLNGGPGKFEGIQADLQITSTPLKTMYEGITQAIGTKKGTYQVSKTHQNRVGKDASPPLYVSQRMRRRRSRADTGVS